MIRLLRRILVGAFGLLLPRLRLAEEQIKAVAEREFLVLRFGERQKQGVAQDGSV
ncbi:hypothetical protein BRDID11002_37340 [Bradyrhizobium diazoefficiens]